MKKIFGSLVALILVLGAILFLVRELSGWNSGMRYARSEIHAATLSDNIYVAGGIGLFRVLDSCEFYAIPDQSWKDCAPLPRPLHHVAMAADESRIYASGGYVALPFKQDGNAALFVYDPQIDKWGELAKLPHPIGQHAMTYHGGKLYLVGGQNGGKDLASLWSYELSTGKWVQQSPMPTARHSHAIAIAGNKLYVTGGRSAALGSEIDIVEVYDFIGDTWQTLPTMPVGRGGHGAIARAGKLHVFGGESLREAQVIGTRDILDLASKTWSNGKPLTKPRHGFAIGDHKTSKITYVIGGGAKPGMHTIYSVTGTVQLFGK